MTNVPPKPPTQKQIVAFDVLLGERDYQDERHGGGPTPTIVDFSNLLIEYTDKLAVDVTVDPTGASPAGGPLKRLREIAAIALHGMEIYGSQPRENHVPASAGITGVLKVVTGPDTTAPARGVHTNDGRVPPPPAPATAAPPAAVSVAAPHNHDAVQLPHHPTTEEHGKK
jgi:hypothetical protein